MNIEGFSEMTATQLFSDCSLSQPYELYSLTEEQLLTLEGFQEKKAKNLISAIQKSKECDLSAFIFALGIPNVGKKTAKDLATRFGSVSALAAASEEDLLAVEEIGEIIAHDIAAFFASEVGKTLVEKLLNAGVNPQSKRKVVSGGAFVGEIVVLTGSLESYTRSQAAKLIEEAGGEIGSSVTSKTTLVVAGEAAGSKLDKARKLGVKIIDEKTLKMLLNS